MKHYFNPSTLTFLLDGIHEITPGCVEVSRGTMEACLNRTAEKVLSFDATGQPIIVDAPPPTFAELKTTKTAAVRALAEQHITAGFVSTALGADHTYPSNRDYQINIIGAKEAGVDLPFLCADANGVWLRRGHTAAELAQVFADGVVRKSTILTAMDTMVASIDAAADQAALDAIDINVGWPA